MSQRFPLFPLVAALLLGACSGPSQTSGQSGPSAEGDPGRVEEGPPVAQFETFDASQYVASPPEEAVEVNHRVPNRLMRGRADEGVKRTLEGYRIQVFSARDKQAAQDFREQVRQWWENNREEAPLSVLGEEPPIIVEYSQPYYRVRIGAFATRDAAERALEFVRVEYPSAFPARSTVTVTQ